MNSKTTNDKTIGKTISKVLGAVLTSSALALTMVGVNAQVVSTPYGNLPAGATPISLSPSAPYTLNSFNTNTQDYSAFGGTNGNLYGGLGYTDLYASSGYGGLGGFGVYDSGGGSAPGGFVAMPLGSGLTFLSSNYGGGYATIGPNGYVTITPGPEYAAYRDAYNRYLHDQATLTAKARSANNGSTSDTAKQGAPMPLSRAITLRRGNNFDVTIGWRGSQDALSNMKVTLLNRYHLPVAQQVTDGAVPAHFAANANTFAALYCRVEVQYADGAAAAITLPLSSALR